MKKNPISKALALLFSIILCFALIACSSPKPPEEAPVLEKEVKVLVDAAQFSRITPEELAGILGEPSEMFDWDFTTANGSYPTTTYVYDIDGMAYEFMIIDNSVVRFTIMTNCYGDNIPFGTELNSDILARLQIIPTNSLKQTVNTGVAIRWSPVNDSIADVWATATLSEDKSPTDIKITYNLNYFS